MKGFSLTLAAALLLTSPALAADGHSWRIGQDSFHVYYDDLDMNSTAGRAGLLARVEKAARKLCAQPLRREEDDCVAGTVAKLAVARGARLLRLALEERDALRLVRR